MGLTRKEIGFLALMLIIVWLHVFALPSATPIYFEGDHTIPVSNAMRLLDGEVMYRDFFHFTPPGTELWYASLFCLFGIEIWLLNATIFVLTSAQLFLVFAISRYLLNGPFKYLPAATYFVIGFRQFGIDGSNRLFSVVLVLAAVLVVLRRRDHFSLITAGGLCGLASFFVQTRGVVGIAAIGIFLIWRSWRDHRRSLTIARQLAALGIGFALIVLITQAYFVFAAGFENYFFANVVFLKNHYSADSLSNLGAYLSDIPNFTSYAERYGNVSGGFRFIRVAGPTLFYYFMVPGAYVLFLFFIRRAFREDERVRDGLMLLAILGALFFFGASAPTGVRLYQISVPALIISTWLLSLVPRGREIATAAFCGLLVLGIAYAVQRQVAEKYFVRLPAGETAYLSHDQAAKYRWVADHTKPGDLLFEAHQPSFYFPLHLKNPTPFFHVRDNDYSPAFQVARLVEALESRPPRLVIWHGNWSKELGERSPGDNLDPLWQFVRNNYSLIKEFEDKGEFTINSFRDIEVWEFRHGNDRLEK